MVNWEQNLRTGIRSLQSATAAEKANPSFRAATNPLSTQFRNVRPSAIRGLPWEVRGPLVGMATQADRDFAQYRTDLDKSRSVGEFSNWYGQQQTRDPRQLNSIANQVRNDFISGNIAPYESRFGEYADWKARDIKRQNASGMLSSGFGAMIPGLAMAAFPGAGLAKIAQGAAMGGMGGGVRGALLGGAASAVAPAINVPGGIGGAIKAPVQTAANVARQFGNPVTAGRQALASALGNYKKR